MTHKITFDNKLSYSTFCLVGLSLQKQLMPINSDHEKRLTVHYIKTVCKTSLTGPRTISNRPGLFETWLTLTNVKYHGNLKVLINLKQRLALTRVRATGPRMLLTYLMTGSQSFELLSLALPLRPISVA